MRCVKKLIFEVFDIVIHQYEHIKVIMEEIELYTRRKRYLGGYFGMYTMGLRSILDFKYTIMEYFANSVLTYFTIYYANKMLFISEYEISEIKKIIIINCVLSICSSVKYNIFNVIKKKEQTNISKRIYHSVNKIFGNAPYKWKEQNTFTKQRELVEYFSYTYNNVLYTFSNASAQIINIFALITIIYKKSGIMVAILVCNACLTYARNRYVEKKIGSYDEKEDLYKDIEASHSNSWVHYFNIMYNRIYKNIYPEKKYNVSESYFETEKQTNKLYGYGTMRTFEVLGGIFDIIFRYGILLYYAYVGYIEMIIFMLLHTSDMTAVSNIVTSIHEISKQCKENKVIIKINEIEKMGIEHVVEHNDAFNHITINNINKKITNTLSLKYDGKININKSDFILLNGVKGCGKSTTIDILAGMYDGHVTDGVFVNDTQIDGEFKSIAGQRVYVKQDLDYSYKNNSMNTLCMTLSELFPHGTYDEICEFIKAFSLEYKLKTDLDVPISTSEKGLSPGETRSFVFASQLWCAFKLKPSMLLLDEPEVGIDSETVKNIFTMICKEYHGIIVLITHSTEIKTFLSDRITQTWNYKKSDGILSFDIQCK